MIDLSRNKMPSQMLPAYVIRSEQDALAVIQEVVGQIAASSSERDVTRTLPASELNILSQSGILGITVPKAFGGADVSTRTLVEIVMTLSEADPSIAQIPQTHFYSVECFRLLGNQQQQQTFFAKVLRGERFGNAVAETQGKTASAAHRNTLLTHTAAGYRINGAKAYCTGALLCDWLAIFVKDEEGFQHMAYVPKDSPGLTLHDDWTAMGQRTTASGSATLDNVPVVSTNILPFQSLFDSPTRLGPYSQIYHAAIQIGIARAALKDCRHFVLTRSRPWIDSDVDSAAKDTLLLADYGALMTELHAVETMIMNAAEKVNDIKQHPAPQALAEASIAVAEVKTLSTELCLNASTKLIEHAGAQAALAQYNLDRHWRNARTHTLHDPVRWKYAAIGNYYLNGILPPRRGYI
ncbi:SfnB family sulfur acquisition oxidoreductase [Pantoea sp. DY-5]|uniref:SfnB family sulfur acquisition oxidoreductase n=1 Tax=Pantoea sp. DY-5 TaxID=2871488 RepID=UPI001C986F11|nr:SfnB family sulfur acquisition oxidoreductase [Pantoea sp. DY-5]MBY4841203.1 SfnB family sulfur acquisition oxidoreductase [Pantoea sp. DY-5]